MTERERLEQGIAALEAQRGILDDAVIDASIAALREKLAALEPEPTERQRKQVTVLFADVSGFTAMSETMDAEDVNDMMNALWRRLDQVITERGGTIDKHMGDAVMALWGAEFAREDDPEKAIRAALAMQAELVAFRGDPQVDLTMRIGINTGPVLLGQVGTIGEYTAIGDTVNTADHLQRAAPVGSILISHDTYHHVRGVFDLEPLEPIQVRGKAEPLRVYVVQRAKPRAFRRGMRGVEGVETRMIGRAAELQRLQDAYHQGDYAGTRAYYERSLALRQEVGDREGAGETLNNLGRVFRDQGNYAEARACHEQALHLFREIDHRECEGWTISELGWNSRYQGDYAEARAYFEQARRTFREINARRNEGWALGALGWIAHDQGDYARAKACCEEALRIFRETDGRQGEGEALAGLGLLFHHLGDDESAREYSQQALTIAQEYNDRFQQALALTHLGHALAGLGQLMEAADAYQCALDIGRAFNRHDLAMESLAGLARVSLFQEDSTQAQVHVEELLGYLETRPIGGTGEPFRIYLTCYRVLEANQDPRARDILVTAHCLLQERAARIDDEELRRSFLENVAAHREIVKEWNSR